MNRLAAFQEKAGSVVLSQISPPPSSGKLGNIVCACDRQSERLPPVYCLSKKEEISLLEIDNAMYNVCAWVYCLSKKEKISLLEIDNAMYNVCAWVYCLSKKEEISLLEIDMPCTMVCLGYCLSKKEEISLLEIDNAMYNVCAWVYCLSKKEEISLLEIDNAMHNVCAWVYCLSKREEISLLETDDARYNVYHAGLQDKWLHQRRLRTAILSRDLFSGVLSGAVYPRKTESLLTLSFSPLYPTFRCPEREIKGIKGFLGGRGGRRGDYDVADGDPGDDDRVGPLDRRCFRGGGEGKFLAKRTGVGG
ncbi:hypothetical protein HNY73_009084 [Argiope bruennichi]|uniref:Uncharacterized protein n=1 Tax=Argiope bruennichi TaxID=94029 RepID=A0A8T0FEY6_ARGBR|nr:hypothetical protein HNY73_009084 [Argiope bruennichi]